MSEPTVSGFGTWISKLIVSVKSRSELFNQPVNASPAVNFSRNEILVKCVSYVAGIGISSVLSYFVLKWLMKELDPSRKEKLAAQKKAEELLKTLGIKDGTLTDYEFCVASDLVCPLDIPISWGAIGGLSDVINELKETVILPFARRDLFSDSSLLSAPKGVLLFGPPGCGKTMIAKATAKASGVRFINLQVSSMLDKWYGESQKRVAAIYSLAKKIQPVIIFIDEIDAFLRSRSSTDHEATALMKTQFMAFWDGLITDQDCQILIMGATNRPDDVDAAIMRRMPSKFYIPLPNQEQRKEILHVILDDNEPMADDVNLDEIARLTHDFSGSDLRELCRTAALARVRDFLQSFDGNAADIPNKVTLRQMEMRDFKRAVDKMLLSEKSQIIAARTREEKRAAEWRSQFTSFLSDITPQKNEESENGTTKVPGQSKNEDFIDDDEAE